MKHVRYSLAFLPLTVFFSVSLNAMHAENQQALLDALHKQDIEQVRSLLISNKVDVNHQSINYGISLSLHESPIRSALHLAVHSGNTDLVKLLLQAGANPTIRGSFNDTPLHIACCKKKAELPEIISLLIEHGADVNAQNNYGETPLHIAVEAHNNTAAQLLLNTPYINSTLRDHRGQTALDNAQNYPTFSDQEAQNIAQHIAQYINYNNWSELKKNSKESRQRMINLLTFDTMSLKKLLVKYVKAHRNQFTDEQIKLLPTDLELT